ncbi:trypsin-like peptidase domain-containing protein [Candidatus Babeliales bacterium]|nr:trypsin-like peptidase domain-containing protein [Candidatus Babeliales bacterium]
MYSYHRSDGFWYRLLTFIFLCVLAGFMIIIYSNQRYLASRVEGFAADTQMPLFARPESYQPEPIQVLQPWAAAQAGAKDTVVQINAQIVEYDLLEPYKTPTQGQGFGSGFIISEQGEIITNAHVVLNAVSVWIQMPSLGKRIIDVDVVGLCPERDIALLKIQEEDRKYIVQILGKMPCLPLGNSDKVYRADEILALGYPLAQQSLKSTTGVVSGRERIGIQKYIQMSAPINPGSSGGPSVNRMGEVIGINAGGIPSAQNVGYVIPINEFKLIAHDLRRVKFLRKPFLGVLHLSGSEALARYLGNPVPSGTYVIDVYNNSLLERAGVQPGDMIYEINDYKIDMYGDMSVDWSEDKISIADYVEQLTIGQKISLVVYRKGRRKQISLTFDQAQPTPIRIVHPLYEPLEYEVLGGMVVMPLALNHVQILSGVVPYLRKYAEAKEQDEPALILTHIFPNSLVHRSRALPLGSIITEVNEQHVTTLDEFRAAVRQGIKNEYLIIKTHENRIAVFPCRELLTKEHQFARDYHYTISPFVQDLVRILNNDKKTTT